jgi:hypothetical protein
VVGQYTKSVSAITIPVKVRHLFEFKQENGIMRKWILISDVSGNPDQNFCERIMAGQILGRWLLGSEILRCSPHDLLNADQGPHLQWEWFERLVRELLKDLPVRPQRESEQLGLSSERGGHLLLPHPREFVLEWSKLGRE